MKIASSVRNFLLLMGALLCFAAPSFAQVGISVSFGPPALPVYEQPVCPGDGYIWTPGYWAYADDTGYYWVPGTWVEAPQVGYLWTPGYWGWGGGFYAWHAGYWGPHVGFYGGINYGFGYGGVGFVGGEWRGGAFFYNRYVTNVSATTVTHVYNRSVVMNENHVAFNGGEGGIAARPTAQEEAAEHEQHTPALAEQARHEQLASQNRQNFASENHGRPAVAATAKAGDFSNHSAVSARNAGGEYHAPAMSPKEARVGSTPGSKSNSNDGFHSFGENGNHASETRPQAESNTSHSTPHASAPKQNAPKQGSRKSSPPPRKSSPPKESRKGK